MRSAALRAIAQDTSLLRVVVAFGAFATAEAATWIAILVYAYGHGGVVEVGIVAFLLLAPAALLAPVAAPLGDRVRRDIALTAGYAAQALCLAAVALAMAAGAHRFLVYIASAAVCMAIAFTRPAIGALLPSLAHEPEHLSAANAAIGALENVGGLFGPLAAAGLLFASSPAAVFAAMAGVMAGSFLAVASLGLDPRLSIPTAQTTSLRASITGGVVFLRRDLDLLPLVSCAALPCVLLGAIEVLVIAVATEQLGKGSHFAGYLRSAFGVGGVVGAAAAVLMIGRRGLALALCLGGILAGASIALLSTAALVPVALGYLLTSGIGHTFSRVMGITLIQRSCPDRFRASVFGVFEGFETASLAIGGLVVSALSAWVGLHGTLVVVGSFLPAVLLLSLPRLLAIDAAARAPGKQILAALRRNPIFAPLSPPDIERLATRASIVVARSGDAIMREGEIGDRYYCVLEGDLEVVIDNRLVRVLGRGDSFGEIALLHAIPRTATVLARSPSTLVAVEGIDFLETVTRHPQSLEHAHAGTRHLLTDRPVHGERTRTP